MKFFQKIFMLLSKTVKTHENTVTQTDKDAARLEEARKWLASRSIPKESKRPSMSMTDNIINPHKSHLIQNIHHDN